jgi:transcriptional regulator with XRE-family HTH domain
VDTLNTLGKNIKLYRSQLGITQAELAEKSGVYRSHLAGIETGSVNPSVRTVEKLAAALEVRVEDLFKEGRS